MICIKDKVTGKVTRVRNATAHELVKLEKSVYCAKKEVILIQSQQRDT